MRSEKHGKSNKMHFQKEVFFNFLLLLLYLPPLHASAQKYDTSDLDQHFKLARAYQKKGQIDSALLTYETALRYWENRDFNGDDSLYRAKHTELLLAIGRCQFQNGKYDESSNTFRDAIKMSYQHWDGPLLLKAKAHLYYGEALTIMHSLDSADVHLKKAADISKGLLDSSDYWLGGLYRAQGDLYRRKNMIDQALHFYERTISIYNDTAKVDHDELAKLYKSLGDLYFDDMGDWEKGLEYHKKFLALRKANYPETHPEVGTANEILSIDYLFVGKFDESIDLFFDALSVYKKAFSPDHPKIANLYHNLGNAFIQKGIYFNSTKDIKEALPYFQEALRIRKEIYPEKSYYIATCLVGIGTIYQRLDSNDMALNYLFESVEMLRDVYGAENYIAGYIYSQIGEVYEQKLDWDNSLRYFQKAMDIFQSTTPDEHTIRAVVLNNFAYMYSRKGDYDMALNYYQKALNANIYEFDNTDIKTNPEFSHQPISVFDYVNSLYGKANCLTKANPTDITFAILADSTWQLAVSYIDKIRHSYTRESSQLNIQQKAFEIIDGALENMNVLYSESQDSAYSFRSFKLAEKSKAIVLQEALKAGEAIKFAEIPAEIQELEHQLNVKIANMEKKVSEQRKDGGEIDSAFFESNTELLRIRNSHDSLINALEINYPKYFDLKYAHKVAEVSEIQSALDEETALVEYFMGEKTLHIYCITANDFTVYSEEIDEDVQGKIKEFIQNLKDRSLALQANESTLGSFRTTAYELYLKLLTPVNSNIVNTKELIIIPDGMLCYLPFETLLTEPGDSINNFNDLPYLVNDFNIRYGQSATMILNDLKRVLGRVTEMDYIGFAPEYGNSSLFAEARGLQVLDSGTRAGISFLTYNQPEVTNAASLLHGIAYTGANATEDNFRQYATSSKIIHLAMHAFINDQNPMYSGLVFANSNSITPDSLSSSDNFLHAYELYNMKLNADLAILSACNTGSGVLLRGEGVMSLSRAFHYAGCRNLVMSLWQADDEATYEIMQTFYNQLKNGFGKDEALRLAKLDFLKSQDRSHPYFWANFVLIGDRNPVEINKNHRSYFYYSVALLVVIFLIVFILKKVKRASRPKGAKVFS
jgi:CHAT domain-containing protein/Tfp pilus assembly protein PilF